METAIAVKGYIPQSWHLCVFWATEKILINIWDVELSMDSNTSKK